MKFCKKCNSEKPKSDFSKNKLTKDGLWSFCKVCSCLISKLYVSKNKEKLALKRKGVYQLNKDKIKIKTALNKEKRSTYARERSIQFPEIYKKYRENNSDKIKLYKIANKERFKPYMKVYMRDYAKKRKLIDPLFKMQSLLRTRVYHAYSTTRWNKNGKTETLLGCSYDIAKQHIQKLFSKGMSWDNYGKWHIDHKIPLASAKTEQDLVSLFHYTNLQPLWQKDNLSKGDKIIEHQTTLTI